MSVGISAEQQSRGYVLVGIPAYNEEVTIAEVINGAKIHADEILVVDDGSDDNTKEQARAAGATVRIHDENRGYGASLQTIFQYAQNRGVGHLVILDADGQHDVNDIPDLVRTQRETDAEIVTGSRFTSGSISKIPAYRRFGLAVINTLTNAGLRLGYSYSSVSDSQCGFRAYNTRAIEELSKTNDIGTGMGASLDILFQAARNEYTIVEVPTRINYEVDNASSQNPIFHGLNLVKSLFSSIIRDRPARVASIAGTLLFTVGLFIFALLQLGVAIAVMIPILITLGLVITLSSRSVTHSDSTDQ